MQYIISRIIAAFIITLSYIFISYKLMKKKINFKDKKIYLSILSIIIISVINGEVNKKFFKTITMSCVFVLIHKILFNQKLEKSVASTLFYQMLLTLSEITFALILIIFFGNNSDEIVKTYLGSFITDVYMSIIPIVLINISFIRKLYNPVLKLTEKISKIQFVYYTIIIIFALSIFPITIYYKIDFIYLVLFYLFMSIGCSVIIYISLKAQNKYNDVSDKYNIAIKSLKDLEMMMNRYKIESHENRNLLSTIRVMITNKDKNIPQFIESVIQTKYKDDDKIFLQMSSIPTGGLRATVYSEILKIKDNNINYNLYVDKNIQAVDLIELETSTVVNICEIISVFIDNAIEEVKKINNGLINISLYEVDEELYIKVSNNYKGELKIQQISEIGYTTKGKGHGYGLPLVKKIIDTNDKLRNEKEITKQIFSQILIIKFK